MRVLLFLLIFGSSLSYSENGFLLEGNGWDWFINSGENYKIIDSDGKIYVDEYNYMIVSQEISDLESDEFMDKAFEGFLTISNEIKPDVKLNREISNVCLTDFCLDFMKISFYSLLDDSIYINKKYIYFASTNKNGVYTCFFINSYEENLSKFVEIIKSSFPI